jgi:CarD family transcriptional regulator
MASVRKNTKKSASRTVARPKSAKKQAKSAAVKTTKISTKASASQTAAGRGSATKKPTIRRKRASVASAKSRKAAKRPGARSKLKAVAKAAIGRVRVKPAKGSVAKVKIVAIEKVALAASRANAEVREVRPSVIDEAQLRRAAAQPSAPPTAVRTKTEQRPAAAPANPDLPVNRSQKTVIATKPAVSAGLEESGIKLAKNSLNRPGFKANEFVVYPSHGVGQIIAIEEQEVAGFTLELFVINFAKDKMTLRVPTSKVIGVGMRKLSDPDAAKKSLDILMGRPRIKRTMWSRRAQEYEAKINSGDIDSIAEVVRDLYRSEAQPEQSYSERQLYEAALDRMAREIAVVQKLDESEALKVIVAQLQKGQKRGLKPEGSATTALSQNASVDEAA